jgi:hypothetical protein
MLTAGFHKHVLNPKYDPKTMTCKNKGPFHLSISEEACENAGGKWFRTPCITLKRTIDQRPRRFDMDNPKLCQDNDTLDQMNLAYVTASTNHRDFTFNDTGHGCHEFCRSLPGYSNQRAMMTAGTSSLSPSVSDDSSFKSAFNLNVRFNIPSFSTCLSSSGHQHMCMHLRGWNVAQGC